MDFKIWLKAIRVPFFTATIIPVVFGYLLAWLDGAFFIWQRLFLTLAGAVCIHAGTNLANDFFDHLARCDESNPTPTPFSGGSRVIQEGLISPKKILVAALAFFAFGSICGLYLNHISGGNVILILGMIGVFLGFFYSARPFKIGYGCLGELATGVGFGPLMVMGAYFVGAQQLSFKVFLVSIPIGILIALVLFINEFPDYVGDKAVGKRTLVVALGKKRSVIIYHALLAAVYIFTAGLIAARFLPAFCLIAFFSLPVAIRAVSVSRDNYEKIYELLPANAATIGLHAMIGAFLCVGIVIDKLWR